MKIVVRTMYSCDIVFFIDEEPKDCLKLIGKKYRTPYIVECFEEQNPENGLVCWDGDDLRLQFCYLGKVSNNPLFYNRVAHEICHIVNNISKLVGLKNDGEGNEHIAYLTGYIMENLFAGILGYKKKR